MNMTNPKVSTKTKLMYAMGDFPFSFSATLIGFFFMIYLTNTIGISAFWAGAIIFIGIAWDAITDPIVGYLNDNTRSKIGRRRKYMILFFFPMAAMFFAMFSVPSLLRDSTEFVKVLMTLALYLSYTTFITLVATPFGAIINEITDDYDERTKMMTFRMIGSILGTLLSIIIPEFLGLSNASQNNTVGYILMGAIFGGLMLVFGYSSALSLRERNRHLDETKHAFDFSKYFISSWKSAPFRQVTIMYMLSVVTINFIQGNLVYFINYKMLLPGLFLPIAGGVMVLAVIFMPLWMIYSEKTSKKKAYVVAVLVTVVSLLSLYFAPAFDYEAAGVIVHTATPEMLIPSFQDLNIQYIADINQDYGQVLSVMWHEFPWVYLSVILLAFGFSGLQMLPFSMVPDAVNFSNSAKEKKEGAYFGIVTFVQKMGWGIGMLLTGIILNASGYLEPAKVFTFDAQTEVLSGQIVLQSAGSVIAISILFTFAPAIFGIMGALSVKNYKVDRVALQKQMESINSLEEVEKNVVLKEVDNALEIENFIRLHEILYKDDPYYVFPIRKDFIKMLKKSLIDQTTDEPCVAYNVYVNGRISGRVFVTLFTARPKTPLEKRQGAFNFFECVDDIDVAKMLISKTDEWVYSHNLDYYYGNTNPLDPDDQRGILIEGFDGIPATMCVYNKPYYQKLLEECGLVMKEDLYSYKLTLDQIPYERYDNIDKVKDRFGVSVRSADKTKLERDVKDVIQVIEESISDDWDIRAPEGDKVYELLNSWKNFLDFDLIKIASLEDGRPIGFTMMIPNFNEALIHLKGKWNLVQMLKLLYYKNRITTTRAMIQMVVKDYQNKGIINMMYQDYFETLKSRHISLIDASTIGSDNFKSRFAIEKLGGIRYRVFRIYGKELIK